MYIATPFAPPYGSTVYDYVHKIIEAQGSVHKCHAVHTHMAGGNSGVCDFSLDSAFSSICLGDSVQIKAMAFI